MSTPTRFFPSPMLYSRASLADQAERQQNFGIQRPRSPRNTTTIRESLFTSTWPPRTSNGGLSMLSPGRESARLTARIRPSCLVFTLGLTLISSTAGLAAAEEKAEPRYHVVYPGQTLGMIAKRHNVTLEALRAANQLRIGESIKPRQRLVIPGRDNPRAKPGTGRDPSEKPASSKGRQREVRPALPALGPKRNGAMRENLGSGATSRWSALRGASGARCSERTES